MSQPLSMVQVTNLDHTVTEQDIKMVFAPYGLIKGVQGGRLDADTSYYYVEFQEQWQAQAAEQLTGTVLRNRAVQVKVYKPEQHGHKSLNQPMQQQQSQYHLNHHQVTPQNHYQNHHQAPPQHGAPVMHDHRPASLPGPPPVGSHSVLPGMPRNDRLRHECTVFVSMLDPGADEVDIAIFFQQAGQIEGVRRDFMKNTCWVEFSTPQQAQAALMYKNREMRRVRINVERSNSHIHSYTKSKTQLAALIPLRVYEQTQVRSKIAQAHARGTSSVTGTIRTAQGASVAGGAPHHGPPPSHQLAAAAIARSNVPLAVTGGSYPANDKRRRDNSIVEYSGPGSRSGQPFMPGADNVMKRLKTEGNRADKTAYVMNFSTDTQEADFVGLFTMSNNIPIVGMRMDRNQGRAWMELLSEQDVDKAVKLLHNQVLKGAAIKVERSRSHINRFTYVPPGMEDVARRAQTGELDIQATISNIVSKVVAKMPKEEEDDLPGPPSREGGEQEGDGDGQDDGDKSNGGKDSHGDGGSDGGAKAEEGSGDEADQNGQADKDSQE